MKKAILSCGTMRINCNYFLWYLYVCNADWIDCKLLFPSPFCGVLRGRGAYVCLFVVTFFCLRNKLYICLMLKLLMKLCSVWVARRPPGYAFVEFDDRRDALDAVHALDGQYSESLICCSISLRWFYHYYFFKCLTSLSLSHCFWLPYLNALFCSC